MREFVTRSKPPLALLEVLDRDGHTRQQMKVMRWPLKVGRALDNDWVLDDAHTALRHLTLDADELALKVQVGDTVNGAWVEGQHVARNGSISVFTPTVLVKAGETTLRVRMASHILPAEVPMEDMPRAMRGLPLLVFTVLLCLGSLGFHTWLTSDPGDWLSSFGSELISSLYVLVGWCAVWALLSKVITRRAHLSWHLRVAMLTVLGWQVARVLPSLIAFSFSVPLVSSFGFVLSAVILATAVSYHLRKVEPRHRLRRRGLAALVLVAAIGTNVWSNRQSNVKLWGDEVYMGQIYPPSFRLARSQSMAEFMRDAQALQSQFADQANEPVEEEDLKDLGDRLP